MRRRETPDFKVGDLVQVRDMARYSAFEKPSGHIAIVPDDDEKSWVTSKEVSHGEVCVIVGIERWGNDATNADVTVLFSDGTTAKTWIDDWEKVPT